MFPTRPPTSSVVKQTAKFDLFFFSFLYCEGVTDMKTSHSPATCCYSSHVSQSGKPRSLLGEFRRHVANSASWLAEGGEVETPTHSGWGLLVTQTATSCLYNKQYSVTVKTAIFNGKKDFYFEKNPDVWANQVKWQLSPILCYIDYFFSKRFCHINSNIYVFTINNIQLHSKH